MAAGSHATWGNIPPGRRVCATCGGKLTLKRDHVEISELHGLAWHAGCRKKGGIA